MSLIRGDAVTIPLADHTVDLIVTSPPYFALRSYTDDGEHYAGQLGSEATPAAFIDALVSVTRECVRVLKPSGSLFVNLGDKYAGSSGKNNNGSGGSTLNCLKPGYVPPYHQQQSGTADRAEPVDFGGIRTKSLMGLPWRYALACIDQLGLILRAEIIWSKPNGLPESVQDRVRRSHEQWFHFSLQPRYYSSVDAIREPHAGPGRITEWNGDSGSCPRCGSPMDAGDGTPGSPLRGTASSGLMAGQGSLIDSSTNSNGDPSPTASSSTISAGTEDASTPSTWSQSPTGPTFSEGTPSPPATSPRPTAGTATSTTTPTPTGPPTGAECAVCANGHETGRSTGSSSLGKLPGSVWQIPTEPLRVPDHLPQHFAAFPSEWPRRIILGWSPNGICVECGEGRRPVVETERVQDRRISYVPDANIAARWAAGHNGRSHNDATITGESCACPTPTAPTRKAVVLDPFVGTGTVPAVANALGRYGVGIDLSADYLRLARWRLNDPGLRAKALQVDRPAPEVPGQASLFA